MADLPSSSYRELKRGSNTISILRGGKEEGEREGGREGEGREEGGWREGGGRVEEGWSHPVQPLLVSEPLTSSILLTLALDILA